MMRLLPCLFGVMALAIGGTGNAADRGKILVIVSSEQALELRDGKRYETGYFLNELAVPVKRLVEEGYAVTFANPKGNRPTMDIHSDSADFFGKDVALYREVRDFHDHLDDLKHPHRLADVVRDGLDQYRAVLFPGGHAPMQDLLQDPSVAAVLQHFHASGKPTALICHGPIALLAAMPGSGNFVQAMRSGSEHRSAGVKPEKSWPYAGYRMTIFSTSEEKIAEHAQLGGEVLFYPQDALRKAGGVVSVAAEWSSNVVHDRELITGQNPSSDDALVKELLAALEANGK